jgi:hypothetical protein
MKLHACRTAAAIVLAVLIMTPAATPWGPAYAQVKRPAPLPRPRAAAHGAPGKTSREPPPPPLQSKPPPRAPFTAADDAVAQIPGIANARFFADSVADFQKALPAKPGPWLILSSGGEDGAFGAGLLNGLSASGRRPDYSVVAGVSTGALMSPFVFAGAKYDNALRDAYTRITAADVFEAGQTPQSFLDDWPLKDFIAKQITPALLADIATQYRAGRRLFIVTTDLDAERSVVWNVGAIAAHGGDQARNLLRNILLASSSVPGAFPPVPIEVEGNGRRFSELHADGGVGGQFFLAPAALLSATADYRLPATALYIIINTGLQPEFDVVQQTTPQILAQSVDMAVKNDTRLMIDRAYYAAKRSGIAFNIAAIPTDFNAPSRGPFDPKYMGALFQTGYEIGKSATPFSTEPPAYPGAPAPPAKDREKPGAN